MNSFTEIDFSKLPAPAVMTEHTYDEVYLQVSGDFKSNNPNIAQSVNFESEPITAVLQSFTYRELMWRQYANALFKQGFLAFATGANLEHHAAKIPVDRLDNESDDDYRARIQLAPEGFSTAGAIGGYIFHAKSVSTDIIDVYVNTFDLYTSTNAQDTAEVDTLRTQILALMQQFSDLTGTPPPGHVHVHVLSEDGAPSPDLLQVVDAHLSKDEIRPVTDFVSVLSANLIAYDVTATLVFGVDQNAQTIIQQAIANAETYIFWCKKFGHTVTTAGLIAALYVDGVENVNLISPANDVEVAPNEVALLGTLSVTEAA